MLIKHEGRVLMVVLLASLMCACSGTKSKRASVNNLESNLSDLRSIQAEQTAQISSLQNSLRELSGRLEELEYSQQQRFGTDIQDLRQDVTSLRKRVPPPPIVPVIALEADEILAIRLPGPEGQSFSDALIKVREGAFLDALPLLGASLEQAYKTNWTANILFWIAVCHDGIGDNRKALAAYHDLITRHKGHPRVALALLRQGSVFIRLGDSKTARLTFQKLIAEFPQSSEAAQARERLKDL